jgi:hypothetical protein
MTYLHGVIAVIGLFVFSSSTLIAATLTVDLNGSADYTDIQSAIDAAADGDTVLVKPGEYVITEPINFNRLFDRDNPGRSPLKNIAVRADRPPEETIIRLSGTAERNSVVVFDGGEDRQSLLEGFTLMGGKGTTLQNLPSEDPQTAGGGVCCTDHSSPEISRCRIIGNNAAYGAGVACVDSSPLLNDCAITINVANLGGGGLYLASSSADLHDCEISLNGTHGSGGGIYCDREASPAATKCTIKNNRTWDCAGGCRGGGVYCEGSSGAGFFQCSFIGNDSYDGAALMANKDSIPTMINCVFYGNRGYFGGAICNHECRSMNVVNCTFAWNSANEGTIFDCFSWGCPSSQPMTLRNCIFWGNEGMISMGALFESTLTENPMFVKEGSMDFWRFRSIDDGQVEGTFPDFIVTEPDLHLLPGSPAIDRGSPDGSPAIDFEDHPRPCGMGIDIGAYEYGDCLDTRFRRGDANADSTTDISDAIKVLSFLFTGGKALSCQEATDVTDDGTVDISDGIALLSYLFLGGKAPSEPFAECGTDPTADGLTCEEFEPCH